MEIEHNFLKKIKTELELKHKKMDFSKIFIKKGRVVISPLKAVFKE